MSDRALLESLASGTRPYGEVDAAELCEGRKSQARQSKAYDGDIQMINSSSIRVHQNDAKEKSDAIAGRSARRADD